MGHKADLPAYVVNDEALSLYVASASGFKGWCLTVGSSEYGDYDVAARSGFGYGGRWGRCIAFTPIRYKVVHYVSEERRVEISTCG